ncbi:MAG: DUF4129 domain-containing protein [Nocardioidaceae bacterium]
MSPLLPALAAPLDPSPDEARSWLREELLRPDYHRENVLRRLLGWVGELFARGQQAAAGAPALATFAAILVFALVAVGILWVASRARRTRRAPREAGPVLEEVGVTAAELRARAEAALAAGRFPEAVMDAFRALALRQVERHRLDDLPGMTAHEVALALGMLHPSARDRIDQAGLAFDLVRYGDRPATADQARRVLQLDDDLAGVRR